MFDNEELMLSLEKKRINELIIWLRQAHLLVPEVSCDACRTFMNEHKCVRSIDGVVFKCKKSSCIKITTTKSRRENSIFAKFKKPLIIILQAILFNCIG